MGTDYDRELNKIKEKITADQRALDRLKQKERELEGNKNRAAAAAKKAEEVYEANKSEQERITVDLNQLQVSFEHTKAEIDRVSANIQK